KVFPLALGKTPGIVTFTQYRDHSLLATRRPDEAGDRALLLARAAAHGDGMHAGLGPLIEDQMAATQVDCEAITLSSFLDVHSIATVDLLKVDVQRDERDVLDGIAEVDWPRIRQLVVETHDGGGNSSELATLLRGRGFHVTADTGGDPSSGGRVMLYATRTAHAAVWRPSSQQPIEWLSPRALAESARTFLGDRLPAYMVAARVGFIAELPRTPNGKIDRNSLTGMPPEALDPEPPLTPPTGEPALTLARLGREVLNVDAVGLESDFYNLGGHSLLAARLANRVMETLAVQPRLADILRNPIFSGMLRIVGQLPAKKDDPIPRAPARAYDPLTPAQRGLFVLAQVPGGNEAYNVARALRLEGRLDPGLLEHAIADSLRRHDSLRTAFALHDGEPVQHAAPFHELAFRMERRTCGPAEESRKLAEAEARRPFDLSRAPLVRAALIRLAPFDHILLFTVHHIVSDGWSMEILLREIFERYETLLEDPASPLPELPFQFRDVLHHRAQREQRESPHIPYWRRKLSGDPWKEALRTDFPRPPDPGFEGSSLRFQLDSDSWQRLQSACRTLGVGPFAMLLAAINVLLHRWMGGCDFVVATNSTGREDARLRNQVGYYADTLLQRNTLAADEPFAAFLERVAQTGVEALDHAVPLEKLVTELAVRRRHGRAVLFDVGFTWYDIEAQTDISLLGGRAGLKVKLWPIEYFPARADLWFFSSPEPGGLSWHWVYNPALFRGETVQALRDNLLGILDQVAANPCLRIRDIALNRGGAPEDPSIIQLNI
ncbi:MAG TPA: condensation domain-containing protein, partial [Bryobacteraceae bacterium]